MLTKIYRGIKKRTAEKSFLHHAVFVGGEKHLPYSKML